jgi:hypothetical protein
MSETGLQNQGLDRIQLRRAGGKTIPAMDADPVTNLRFTRIKKQVEWLTLPLQLRARDLVNRLESRR